MNTPARKGWCPGTLRPMRTGDGLLVRLRIGAGVLPPSSARGIAECASRFGNGLLAQSAEMGALPTLYAAAMADVNGGDYIGPDGFQQMRGYPTKVGCRALARA